MIKRIFLIIYTILLCEITMYTVNTTLMILIYFLGLTVIGMGYYKGMEFILNETSKRFKK